MLKVSSKQVSRHRAPVASALVRWKRRCAFPSIAVASVTSASLSLALSGCGTSSHVVLSPLETKYPVSASQHFVDGKGEIVRRGQYEVVKSFAFDKVVEAPLGEDSETPLELQPDLDRLVAQYNGDAVTGLKIVGSSYEVRDIGPNADLKFWGWTSAIPGTAFLLTGALVSPDEYGRDALLISGVGLIAVGIGAYLLSYAYDGPATWTLHIEGDVIRVGGASALHDRGLGGPCLLPPSTVTERASVARGSEPVASDSAALAQKLPDSLK